MQRRRTLVIALAVVGVVLLGATLAFAFGKPVAPVFDENDPAAAAVPPPDPSSPLAVEIPGCRCHSEDPQVVAEHAQYRMNQCFGCHAGGMPEMGQ